MANNHYMLEVEVVELVLEAETLELEVKLLLMCKMEVAKVVGEPMVKQYSELVPQIDPFLLLGLE